jgi:predicted TIM-barrel fold metal-dependent hydrolase
LQNHVLPSPAHSLEDSKLARIFRNLVRKISRFAPLAAFYIVACAAPLHAQTPAYEFNDSHCHLTNNIQEGPSIHDFLNMMGTHAGRVALFGVPLQQEWSYRVDGDRAPTYYLHSDSPLYYYSFTDAAIAVAYKSLSKEQQARFDPMITGFNPSDMYAADHIRRVLETFPGVFTGIGEFTIHKEFVSAKIPGEVASLENPALDRILDFAAEAGLVVILHNDIDLPFAKDIAKDAREPAYLKQLVGVFKRHPRTTIIWAHTGLGRTVAPRRDHLASVESILSDPALPNIYVDISWDEVAKYFVADPNSTKALANLIQRYPDRFLFGSDAAAPADQTKFLKTFTMYAPLWNALDAETSAKVRLHNYERLFDAARLKVRAWESAHVAASANRRIPE